MSGPEIVQLARDGDCLAVTTLERLVDRLGRALAMVCNPLDPDIVVVAGGLSNVREIFEGVSDAVSRYIFSGEWAGRVAPAAWGDASGVRGAARLWPLLEQCNH